MRVRPYVVRGGWGAGGAPGGMTFDGCAAPGAGGRRGPWGDAAGRRGRGATDQGVAAIAGAVVGALATGGTAFMTARSTSGVQRRQSRREAYRALLLALRDLYASAQRCLRETLARVEGSHTALSMEELTALRNEVNDPARPCCPYARRRRTRRPQRCAGCRDGRHQQRQGPRPLGNLPGHLPGDRTPRLALRGAQCRGRVPQDRRREERVRPGHSRSAPAPRPCSALAPRRPRRPRRKGALAGSVRGTGVGARSPAAGLE